MAKKTKNKEQKNKQRVKKYAEGGILDDPNKVGNPLKNKIASIATKDSEIAQNPAYYNKQNWMMKNNPRYTFPEKAIPVTNDMLQTDPALKGLQVAPSWALPITDNETGDTFHSPSYLPEEINKYGWNSNMAELPTFDDGGFAPIQTSSGILEGGFAQTNNLMQSGTVGIDDLKEMKTNFNPGSGGLGNLNPSVGMFDAAAQIGTGAIDLFARGTETNRDNFTVDVNQGAMAAKGGLKGAAKGAAMGSIIPGVGTLIGGAIGGITGAIGGLFKGNKEEEELQRQLNTQRTNRHRAMRLEQLPTARTGGTLTYSGDSHEDPSGGIKIDEQGNDIRVSQKRPVAVAEDKEVVWFDPDENRPYIFPYEKGKGAAVDITKTINKLKMNTDQDMTKYDPLLSEAVEKQFKNAKLANEIKHGRMTAPDMVQKKCGGKLPRKQLGGEPDPLNYKSRDPRFYVAPDPLTGTRMYMPDNNYRTFSIDENQQQPLISEYEEWNPSQIDIDSIPTIPISQKTVTPTIPRVKNPNTSPMEGVGFNPPDISTDLTIDKPYIRTSKKDQYTPNLSPLGHLASGIGSIADYYAFKNARPEDISLGRVGAERVSYAQDRIRQQQEAADARRINATTARNLGLNAGQTMANTTAANTGVNKMLGRGVSSSFENEENTNAQLRQQVALTNAQMKAQEEMINAQQRAYFDAQLAARNPVSNLARTAASYFKDNAAYKTEWDMRRMNNPNARIDKPEDSNWISRLFGENPDITWDAEYLRSKNKTKKTT